MRLQSKGLGKITLPFRLGESRITKGDDCIVFEGRITEKKVNWPYRGELEDPDIVNFRSYRHIEGLKGIPCGIVVA